MDTTKDIVDEENNNVDVATDDQPDVVNNTTNTNIPSTTSSSGLQQIEDDNSSDMPLPMGMAEVISNRAEPPKQIGKVEQIDDNDVGPKPPAAMLEASLNATDISNKMASSSTTFSSTELVAYLTEASQSGKINSIKEAHDMLNSFNSTTSTISTAEYINELSPPVPFDSAKFEDDEDTIAKKKAKDEMNQKPAAVSNNEVVTPLSDRDSIYEPSRELIEGSEGISGNTNTGRGGTNRRGWGDIESRVACRDIESQIRTDNNNAVGIINNNSMVDTEANVEVVPTSANQEAEDTEMHIPEAFLVEDGDGEVYDATPLEPTLPWWKQKRTRILVGVVSILLGTMAIALGVSLAQSNNPGSESTNSTMTVFVTPPPTPPRIYECFREDDGGYGGILYRAVRAYASQVCAINQVCPIAQSYGWPINSWCVGNVTDMSYLFDGMDTFNEDINGWNTSSVTSMQRSFMVLPHSTKMCLTLIPRVLLMAGMFAYAGLFDGNVSSFDTLSVTDMRSMFRDATVFNQDVSHFDTSSVTDMRSMSVFMLKT